MSKDCPIYGKAISIDCIDCDNKICKSTNKIKYRTIVIGIDQSYNNTGISIIGDTKILKIKSINLQKYNSNSDKRSIIHNTLNKIINKVLPKCDKLIVIIERIRLRSQGFINIDYIKSIGALNCTIIDVFHKYNIPVYSVDTRCWKSQVIGTSKPKKNKYNIPEEKWPTIEWLINKGYEEDLLIEITNKRKNKNCFIRNNKKYTYNNDAADSCGIAMFYFVGDKDKLKLEK